MNGLLQFVEVLIYLEFYYKKVCSIESNFFWHFKIRLCNKNNTNVKFPTSSFLLLIISAIISSKTINTCLFLFGLYFSTSCISFEH